MAERVHQLGADIARDYAGKNAILVASLKSSTVFVADLSRAVAIPHELDFVELAGYRGEQNGDAARLIKDLDTTIEGRHVLVVQDVVDTGLTLNYLVRLLLLRMPETLAAAALLDRPYRRLVDDLPLRYVGFTVPDEFFVGYGFDLDERWRGLPDLRLLRS
ncbi:MAG: phosphoribosyltransferase [Gaiellaceae bacterium]